MQPKNNACNTGATGESEPDDFSLFMFLGGTTMPVKSATATC